MPERLGAGSPRIAYARELLQKKGRRQHGHFIFEGATLLAEAVRAGSTIDALYVTPSGHRDSTLVRKLEDDGVETFVLDERTFAKISDVESPSGIAAIAPIVLTGLSDLLNAPGLVLVLARLNDPGNAGTLLRSADAFGVSRVIFGSLGVEPYHPKVVRGAMGATFRLGIAVADAAELRGAAAGWQIVGTAAGGTAIGTAGWAERSLLIVGHERAGLGDWAGLCDRIVSIPMREGADSLNAAVAGSLALYEATRKRSS